jgi:hypothetical protein
MMQTSPLSGELWGMDTGLAAQREVLIFDADANVNVNADIDINVDVDASASAVRFVMGRA